VNLISNAKHALEDAPVEPKLITLMLHQRGQEVRLSVQDNGSGIKLEHMKKIFTHGFTTKQDGHGFGLHNCANAVQEMGGKLSAHSDGENRGATFTLTLPLAETMAPSRMTG
jgi:C4-dicarboxylate-specific signal transduction histidine kinase